MNLPLPLIGRWIDKTYYELVANESRLDRNESFTRSSFLVWNPISIDREISIGTRNKVKIVDILNPPINAVPMPRYNSVPAPSPKASGIMPKILEITVIIIGRNRVWQETNNACRSSIPALILFNI